MNKIARVELNYPFKTIPTPGTAKEVSPGIFWVRMPLPFQLNHINLYLLKNGDGWTIVDTGYGNDETKGLWRRVWPRVLGGRPITRLIVTHFHPDHMGNAGWLAKTLDLVPHMTQAEWLNANLAFYRAGVGDIDTRIPWYVRNGLGPKQVEYFRAGHVPYANGVTIPPAYIRIRDGDRIEAVGHAWEVHVGAGHSPEHACLYSPDLDILLGGDQILPDISPNISAWPNEPEGDPLGEFLASLYKFEKILSEDTLVLPSHGRPFRGVDRRISWLHEHHAERLGTILELIDQPKAAAELIDKLFPFQFDGHQLGFAMGEAIAHLNRLVHAGSLRRVIGDDEVIRYECTNSS